MENVIARCKRVLSSTNPLLAGQEQKGKVALPVPPLILKAIFVHQTSAAPQLARYVPLASFLFALVFGALPKAQATVVTVTMTGIVTSGQDTTGVFGFPPFTKLNGLTANLVFSFDDTKGVQTIQTLPPNGTICDAAISSTTTSNPGTAVLQIGNGTKSATFGTATDATVVSLARLMGGACQILGSQAIALSYDIAEDYISTAGGDSIIATITEQGASYASDASWEYSFSATPVVGLVIFSLSGAATAEGQFTVTNITVAGPNSTASSAGLQFIPVTPCRVADTRNAPGAFGGPELAANTSRAFNIPQSACAIPPSAVAYSVNVTAVPNGSLGYLTLWPSGQPQPTVSTLNSDGRVKANAAVVPAGTNGGVSVFVTDATNMVLDIDGYFVPAGTSSALAFYPLTPCRVVDTRNAAGPLGGPSLSANSSRDFSVQSSNCAVPSNAQAYSLNVTAIPKGSLGYLSIWPSGASQPLASTLNAPTGTVVANASLVPAGQRGAVSVFATQNSDVILDVNGYFAAPTASGLSLYTVAPCRVIDTRNASGPLNGLLSVAVEASSCAPPSAARSYVLNATVVPTGTLGYLTLWPAGESQPTVSTLNAGDSAVTSNMAITPTLNGSISAFSSNSTQLILDLSSYFAP